MLSDDNFFTARVTRRIWRRVTLILLLSVSLWFNYMLYRDNVYLQLRHDVMEQGFIDDYLGYNYCDSVLDKLYE